jgi:epoxyqueuosine reductase
MPENLTRRAFLKDLGLLGVGITMAPPVIGATVASSDFWNDSWKPGSNARPAWVKTVDKPTTEINWDEMKRYDARETSQSQEKFHTAEQLKQLRDRDAELTKKRMLEDRPGFTLKDQALTAAARLRLAQAKYAGMESRFVGPTDVLTPEQRGVPRYTASPEEAARVVSAAARFLGAAMVGFVELDSKTTEKLVYTHDDDGKQIEFADVERAEETKDKRIIPNKCRYAIVYAVQMSEEMLRYAPAPLANATTFTAYEFGENIQTRLQGFLRGLGYQGPGENKRGSLGSVGGFAVMAGLGEQSRLNRIVTPEYGPTVRLFKMFTDLPLAPTKPINAGIMQFCKTCKKCAAVCPSKALSYDDEPSWKVKGTWSNPGHKEWFEDAVKCRDYWYEASQTGCSLCFAVCPYASKDQALIHQITKSTIAAAPIFNGALTMMEEIAYGSADSSGKPLKDPAAWWSLDLPEFGIDTSRAKRERGG